MLDSKTQPHFAKYGLGQQSRSVHQIGHHHCFHVPALRNGALWLDDWSDTFALYGFQYDEDEEVWQCGECREDKDKTVYMRWQRSFLGVYELNSITHT